MKKYLSRNLRTKFVNYRNFFFTLRDKHPFLGIFLRHVYYFCYNIKFLIQKKFLLFKSRLNYGKLYFEKTYWINPEKLQYVSGIRFDKWGNYLRVLGGDWDSKKNLFEESIFYMAFKERFLEDKKWEQTKYYEGLLERQLEKKSSQSKIIKIIDERFRRFEELYFDIKEKGFKSKREISKHRGWFTRTNISTILDDISADVGRNGQLLTGHGKHRLSIAKILNIPKIPVTLIVRHKNWMEFRANLIQFLKKNQRVNYKEMISHPDLRILPFKLGEIPFKMLKDNISNIKGKLLDIGAQLGYFCHKFEDLGYDCVAIENNPLYTPLLKKLKKIENKHFKIVTTSIFDYCNDKDLKFEVVLALDGFKNLLCNEESYEKLIQFLKGLKINELILGVKQEREKKKFQSDLAVNPKKMVDFIINNSCLDKTLFIGKTKSRRLIFRLITSTLIDNTSFR